MATEYYKDLMKEYRRLAKRADQRLLELERLSKKSGYENVLEFAYKNAMHDIRSWSGSGKKRFNTKAPDTTIALKAKISDIKRFLDSPTSVKRMRKNGEWFGIDPIFQERAKSINEMFGTSFSWQELAIFFNSKTWEKLNATYKSSGTVVTIINTLMKTISDQNIKDINDINFKNVRVKSEHTLNLVKDAIKNNLIEIKDLK